MAQIQIQEAVALSIDLKSRDAKTDRYRKLAYAWWTNYPRWVVALEDIGFLSLPNLDQPPINHKYKTGRPTENKALKRYKYEWRVQIIDDIMVKLPYREQMFARKHFWQAKTLMDVAEDLGLHRNTCSSIRDNLVNYLAEVIQEENRVQQIRSAFGSRMARSGWGSCS